MMVLSNLLTATAAPLGSLPSMPFGLQDYNAVWQAMDGKLGKLLRADLEKAGYLTTDKILDSGFHQMTSSSKPINTVGGHAGLQIARPAEPADRLDLARHRRRAYDNEFLRTLYRAADRCGRGSGRAARLYIETNRLFEVQKYLSLTSHIWDGLVHARSIRAPSAAFRKTCRIWSWTASIRQASMSETTSPA